MLIAIPFLLKPIDFFKKSDRFSILLLGFC
jgi:hypothetical protein